jgi:iron complex outermembrane recepter protein
MEGEQPSSMAAKGRNSMSQTEQRAPLRLALGPVALAAALALGAVASLPVRAQAAAPAHGYDIPADTLENALNRFGREAGILLSFPTELTAGLRSNGLRGSYTVQGGLDSLLAGSGLQATPRRASPTAASSCSGAPRHRRPAAAACRR